LASLAVLARRGLPPSCLLVTAGTEVDCLPGDTRAHQRAAASMWKIAASWWV